MEDKIRYGIIGVHKQFREKEQAIAYAKFLKLSDNSVYLILPPDMTQKMIEFGVNKKMKFSTSQKIIITLDIIAIIIAIHSLVF